MSEVVGEIQIAGDEARLLYSPDAKRFKYSIEWDGVKVQCLAGRLQDKLAALARRPDRDGPGVEDVTAAPVQEPDTDPIAGPDGAGLEPEPDQVPAGAAGNDGAGPESSPVRQPEPRGLGAWLERQWRDF